jgi:polar amino acid transport system permease protein
MTFWDILVTLLIGFPLPPEMVAPGLPLFLQRAGGLVLSVLVTIFSLAIGAGIGMVLALSRREVAEGPRRDPIDRWIFWALGRAASAIVEGVRGLPIMLLVLLTFYLPYSLVGLRLPGFVLAVAAFSLYAGVYACEIIRSGFRSVEPGLRHAGRVLGLTPRQILIRIELPLALRNMNPDLINLAITVFKDTSTLAVVALPELTYTGRRMLMSEPMSYGLVLSIVLACYWVPASFFSALAARAQRGQAVRGTYRPLL